MQQQPQYEVLETNKVQGNIMESGVDYTPNDDIRDIIQQKIKDNFENQAMEFEWVDEGIGNIDSTLKINNQYKVHFYIGFGAGKTYLFSIETIDEQRINKDEDDYIKIKNAVKDSFEGIQIAGMRKRKNLSPKYKMASRRNVSRKNRKNVSRKNRKVSRKNRKASTRRNRK